MATSSPQAWGSLRTETGISLHNIKQQSHIAIYCQTDKKTVITSTAGTKDIFLEYLWRNKASRTLFAKWPK